ncbi:MAG: hypothetical protein ABI835_13795, partial [Chloroflexota bacterium]
SPWQLATSEDARNQAVGEKVSLRTCFLRFYLNHLLGMVSTNPTVGRAFFDVMHLLKPPTVLFQPRVALNVLRSMLTVRDPLQPSPAKKQKQAETGSFVTPERTLSVLKSSVV